MRDHYDFSTGIQGKYAARFKRGVRIVVLDPDLARVFRDSRAVNRALRRLLAARPRRRNTRRVR